MHSQASSQRHKSVLLRARTLFCSYGAAGLATLSRDWVSTRLTCPGARLLRRPIRLRGRRWMQLGARLTTGPELRMDAFPPAGCSSPILYVGDDVQINDHVHIAAVNMVRIGDRVLIASKVFITDHNHGNTRGDGPHESPNTPPAERALVSAPVHIEDDVWLGEFVVILPGVTIGRGSIVGAMSVVTRSVPAYTIVAGSPAKPIKRYNFGACRWETV